VIATTKLTKGFVYLACALLVLATPAVAQDLVFTLHNKSSYQVVEFYTSPSEVNNWEEDVLGDDILRAGRSLRITIADGRRQCLYDVLFVFEDGDEVEDHGINLCETGSYTIRD
jgi:hypothetical protein